MFLISCGPRPRDLTIQMFKSCDFTCYEQKSRAGKYSKHRRSITDRFLPQTTTTGTKKAHEPVKVCNTIANDRRAAAISIASHT